MRKFSLLVLGLLLLLLAAPVFGDGIPIDPVRYKVPSLTEEKQLALIDFDGEKYGLHLFVSIDFTGYESEQLLWIVPFEQAPDEVNLEAKTFNQFKEEFADFDEEMQAAINANEAYFEGGFTNEMLFVEALHFVPGPFWAPLLLLTGFMGSPTLKSSGTYMETAPMDSMSSAYGPGLEIVGFEDFGELGTAITYNVKDTASLANFFQVNKAEVPENLNEYQNKIIVVFRLNKTQTVLNALAGFEFENSEKIFYPSSTTKTWEGKPDNYEVRVKAPKDFKLTPNFDPNIEVVSLSSQYLVFTADCDPFASHHEIGFYKNNCRSGGYYDPYYDPYYGMPVEDIESGANESGHPLINDDLEIMVERGHKALPVGFMVASITSGLVMALILIFICWLAAVIIFGRQNGLELNAIKTIVFALGLPVAWFLINLALAIATASLMGVMGFILLLLMAMFSGLEHTLPFALGSLMTLALIGAAVLLPLVIVGWLLFIVSQRTDGFRNAKLPAADLSLRDFLGIYGLAVAACIVLNVLVFILFAVSL